VFGFLGPNGAGKTTTIHILAILTRPDGGTARVLGFDVVSEADAIRARVAVTGQFAALDDDLTGYENLIVLGRLRGVYRAASKQRADELLAAFDLTASAGRPVLTTQYLEEADQLAEQIAVIDHGRIAAEGTNAPLGPGAARGPCRSGFSMASSDPRPRRSWPARWRARFNSAPTPHPGLISEKDYGDKR
jgi:ABC-type multidrug transport system ATPase subunit